MRPRSVGDSFRGIPRFLLTWTLTPFSEDAGPLLRYYACRSLQVLVQSFLEFAMSCRQVIFFFPVGLAQTFPV